MPHTFSDRESQMVTISVSRFQDSHSLIGLRARTFCRKNSLSPHSHLSTPS